MNSKKISQGEDSELELQVCQRKSRLRRQRAREATLWGHALDRLRERCDPTASLEDLKSLALVAARIHSNHVRGIRSEIYAGGVLRVDGIESVLVRCPHSYGVSAPGCPWKPSCLVFVVAVQR